VRKLFKPDPISAIFGMATVIIQLLACYFFSNLGWGYLVIVSYIVGGTLNHSMVLGCHELTHDLWFKNQKHNILFGYVMNLCIGVPFFRTFKRYHLDHHAFQGSNELDTDIPSAHEGL